MREGTHFTGQKIIYVIVFYFSDKPPDFSISYLFLYNMFQFIGFFYILVSLSYNLIKRGPGKLVYC